MRIATGLGGGLLVSLACQASETPEQARARMDAEAGAARREIEATIASYERWITQANVDSIVTMATEDATFLPPNEPALVGRDVWRRWFEPLITAGQWNQDLVTETVVANGPIAVEHGRYTMSFTPGPNAPAGLTAFSDTGKYLWHWRRVEGRWAIAAGIWNSDRPLPIPPPGQ
jgi:ketosteroid isomerase-like protein